jgi:hypothetical protein
MNTSQKLHLFANIYLVRIDKRNYGIQERNLNKKTLKEEFETVGYHSSLSSLATSIKELYVKENIFEEEIDSMIKSLETLNNLIRTY